MKVSCVPGSTIVPVSVVVPFSSMVVAAQVRQRRLDVVDRDDALPVAGVAVLVRDGHRDGVIVRRRAGRVVVQVGVVAL